MMLLDVVQVGLAVLMLHILIRSKIMRRGK